MVTIFVFTATCQQLFHTVPLKLFWARPKQHNFLCIQSSEAMHLSKLYQKEENTHLKRTSRAYLSFFKDKGKFHCDDTLHENQQGTLNLYNKSV